LSNYTLHYPHNNISKEELFRCFERNLFFLAFKFTSSTPERRPSDIKDSEVYKMCQAADAQGKDSHLSDLNENEADASCDFNNESRVKDGVPLDDQGDSRERVFSPPPGPTRGQGLSFRVLQWLTDTTEDEQNDNEESRSSKLMYSEDVTSPGFSIYPNIQHNLYFISQSL
jgi:hypothetical protein